MSYLLFSTATMVKRTHLNLTSYTNFCSFSFQSLICCQRLWQFNVLEEYNTSILRVEEMGSRYSYIPPKHL